MNGTQDAIELLATSLEALCQEVLPALDGKARISGLMVVNAVGIAMRVLLQGRSLHQREQDGLRMLLGRDGDTSVLRTELVRAIRDGKFDGTANADAHTRLVAFLHLIARGQCAIDRPKTLGGREQA